MTDQDWTKEDDKKMHELLRVVYHREAKNLSKWSCSCGEHFCDPRYRQMHIYNNNLNFSSPSDKELGVMLRWCRAKMQVSFTWQTADTSRCEITLRQLNERGHIVWYSAHGKSEALAIRDATRAYLKEKT
jgi:hypothetical protein